ncbi:aminotransferase, class III [Aureobasidium sp. EXF-12298]|nr:aminotransferase, class III [Aureobasidium sp. EXF-12298]KAI4760795.1 aminotransferase, class III [Aureobasidium sp. EXF-12344]KAI4777855.1 aminotransferase, class III [Aureobasidium sp. EXF-3400]
MATIESKSAVFHRSLHTDPISVVGASGNYLHLADGGKLLDATGGAAVSCLGHGHKRVKEAIISQLDVVSYVHSATFATEAAELLAKELVESTGGAMSKAYIVSSGSEAMEAALKLARQHYLESKPPQPPRTKFIARQESYHGTTLGALSISGHKARRAPYEPMLLPNMSRVSACNAYRGMKESETEAEYVDRLAKELDDEFQRLGPETVCAFVAEPVVGAALGCVPAVKGYFQAVRAICDKYGALLILDEVMCGMGRTGTMHAWQSPLIGVVPDIQTIGKGLGGGYAPIAGVLISRKVTDTLFQGTGAFTHGQTYQGHPVSCRAALEVLRTLRDEKLVQNAAAMGEKLEELLKRFVLPLPHVGNVRGKGLFWGIEFVKDKTTKEPFDPKENVATNIHEKGLSNPHNITLYPGTGTADGKIGDHILLAPAYNVTAEVIELIVQKTARVIEEYFQAA